MARTLILHIGMPKTGSTSIQQKLARERQSLLAQGIYYPATEGDYKHTLMALAHASFSGVFDYASNHVWQGRDPAAVSAEYEAKFAAEMQALPPNVRKVIVSAEQFAQYVRKPEDIERLQRSLSPLFDDFEIVLYLRRQDAHFSSTYAQGLRVGRIGMPDMTQLSDWLHDYNYADLVGRWASVFGDAAMRVRIFERVPGKNFDVVTDFAEVCGFTFAAETGGTRNVSMNAKGQRILIEASKLVAKNPELRDLMQSNLWRRLSIAVTQALPGSGWQPARGQAAEFMAQFTATNDEVRRRFLPERESLFSMNFSNLPEQAPAPDMQGDFSAACSVILDLVQANLRRDLQQAKITRRRAAKDGDVVAERAALVDSIELDENDVHSRLLLAKIQADEGAFEASRQNVTRALQLEPDSKLGNRLLARLERVEKRASRKKPGAAAGPDRAAGAGVPPAL